jgi:4-hydroxybenzoate polyprenyltransferase
MSVMAVGLGIMACVERFGKATVFTNDIVWPALLTLLMVSVFRRGVFAIMSPTPEKVQATVKQAIYSLIVLDAAVCMAIRGPMAAIAVLALMVPMLVLGRWVYST